MELQTFTLVLALCAVVISAHSKIRQKRTWIIESLSIEEEGSGPFPYVLDTIHVERKYLVNFAITGRGVDATPIGVLSINSKTGDILVHKKVDYELFKFLRVNFEAKNVSNDEVDTRLGIEVKILDINDNPPVFTRLTYETTINESLPQGNLIMTVHASDKDNVDTPNGTFNFRLVSTSPKTDNAEFYMKQNQDTGNIYFKGCLDYEKAQKYILLIEAKDNGQKVQLSSTTTVVVNITDYNNHLPEISGHTGPKKIKERQSGVEVLRVQVTDKDTKGSPAWKAKFTLHGDKESYFKIRTDPNTNEGILSVVKAMDYEEQVSINVWISVENEVPYFYCKVRNPTTQGLWDVESSVEGPSGNTATPLKLYPVTIAVEDINDPPEFVPPVKKIMVMENTKVGTILETLTAEDPEESFGSSFKFFKGEDKEDWVTVDPKTGVVSVAKVMDRESPFVQNSIYNVTVYVVDNAQPPMTGTGTIVIQLRDQNDNVPLLTKTDVYMCLSDQESLTNITAKDLDLPPYTEPFHYELLGDVKGKWRIEPNPGTTATLVREKNLYPGHYELQIKISDNQGSGLVQNLSVTVCDCVITPSCHVHRSIAAQPSYSTIGIIIFALLLLIVFLLMGLSCGVKKTMIPTDEDEGLDSHLIKFNIEAPGTDCKMAAEIIRTRLSKNIVKMSDHYGAQDEIYTRNVGLMTMAMLTSKNYSTYHSDDLYMSRALSLQLNQRLLQLRNPQEEFGDYNPRCYADEGESETGETLDRISISERNFNPDSLTNSDFQFHKLATMCQPDLMF